MDGVSLHEYDVDLVKDSAEFEGILRRLTQQEGGKDIRLVFAVHAYRAGRLLLRSDGSSFVPFVIILGGTDVNEYQRDSGKAAVMARAVRAAK